ncbi:hypothetical protein BWO91_09300 [Plantibacter flavus]|nr:hypothetical protein BWO91_09300 [Plantibacter flavus]
MPARIRVGETDLADLLATQCATRDGPTGARRATQDEVEVGGFVFNHPEYGFEHRVSEGEPCFRSGEPRWHRPGPTGLSAR